MIMTESQLATLSGWFDSFVATFRADSVAEQRNYDLKIEHTRQVRANMERLAASLKMTAEEQALAAAIALSHDVGRFPQYRDYATFNDVTSVNHAALAVETLKDEGVLVGLTEAERLLLLQAVALHNRFHLPVQLKPQLRRYVLLIRDADKLDIWRVLIEYCTAPPEERAGAVAWDLPESGTCSPAALAEVIAGRMPNRDLLKTVDDIKLLQLSWAYDLNFSESFRMLDERGYVEILAGLLPADPRCASAVEAVRGFVQRQCGGR